MMTVRNRFPHGCNCLKSAFDPEKKIFYKREGYKNIAAIVISIIGIFLIALLFAIWNPFKFTIRSPMKSTPVIVKPVTGIKELIKTDNIRNMLHTLTKHHHVAGTENNLRVAEIIKAEMIKQGLENVHFNEYNVLLSYPNWTNPNTIEVTAENGTVVFRTTGRSPSILKDEQPDPSAEIQWLAYSAGGIADGEMVYVNRATSKDIEHLESLGIDLKGKILLARYSSNFRGNIAKMAVEKGAAGCLIYSDPMQVANMGINPENTFGNTDKMPSFAVQRGAVFVGYGDPRTPAFPSIGDLFKEKTEEDLFEEKSIPTIPIMPIPYSAAQWLFENMKGEVAIPDFQGSLNVTYRYGPGLMNNQKLKMRVHAKNEERKIQNVLGFIKGSEEPEKFVILSNHFDAWTYGAVDPNSGTSTLLEVSRAMKSYQNNSGWMPARSILFAHWDAEEYGLIGSTEFAEEYRVQLMRRAVGVVNMDLIGGNQTLLALSNPTVANVLRNAASAVPHPNEDEVKQGRKTLYDSWQFFSPSKTNRSLHPYQRIPAGGSDHLPFYDYLGIPIIMFLTSSLDAPPTYPLYHTIYETPFLVEKILDPQFKMHKAISEMFIEMALKFADEKILPYDLRELIDDTIFEYLPRLEVRLNKAQNSTKGNFTEYLKDGVKQFTLLKKTVQELSEFLQKRNVTQLESLPFNSRVEENNRLIEFEKCFINPYGASNNPQARHLLFHPSADNWYDGDAISQVHDLITKLELSQNFNTTRQISRRIAKEIALVNVAFICAKHSLNDFLPS